MLLAALRPDEGLPVLGLVCVVYIVLGIFLFRSKLALELKLLAAGLLTAILAIWCGQLAAESGASVQVRAGAVVEGGRVVVGGETAGTLERIALVLVLSGAAVTVLGRSQQPSMPVSQEEASRGNVV